MKNKIVLLILAVMALALSVSMVSAAVTVTSTYSETAPTFGSDSQQASNPNADDEAYENIYVTSNIPVSNDGGSAVTISSIEVTPTGGFSASDINISLVSSVVVASNGTADVALKARIPEELDAVDSDGDEKAFKIATVTLKDDTDATLSSFDVYMQRENKLELRKAYVTSNENDDKSISDDDRVNDLKPGEDVEVRIKVENNYQDSDDVNIEDIEVVVEINDGDMDVDEQEDINDLKPEEDDEVIVKFDIEDDVDEDTYDGYIYVTGEDENGALHGERWEIEWRVEKKSHDLEFSTATAIPSSVTCDREITLTAKVKNIGSNDEEEVSIYIKNSVLGIDFEQELLELDEGDSLTKSFIATIPDTVASGSYPVRFTVYYSGKEADGVQADLEDIDVIVGSCSQTVVPEEEEEIVVVQDEGIVTDATTISDDVVETSETSFRDTKTYTALLIIALVVVIVLGVVLIVKFLILK